MNFFSIRVGKSKLLHVGLSCPNERVESKDPLAKWFPAKTLLSFVCTCSCQVKPKGRSAIRRRPFKGSSTATPFRSLALANVDKFRHHKSFSPLLHRIISQMLSPCCEGARDSGEFATEEEEMQFFAMIDKEIKL